MKRLWSRITGRLVIGVITIHLVLTPLLFYGVLLIVERSFVSQFIDQVRNNTLLYTEVMKPLIENGDTERRASFLYETKIGGDVVYAEYLDPQGSSERSESEANEVHLEFREDFSFGENSDNVYFIAAGMFSDSGGEPLGFLRLGYDERSVQEQINSAYGLASFIAAGYIVFSTLLAIAFGHRLIRPVSSLRQIATDIAAGEANIEFAVNTDIYELKRLADDLQSMHRSLLGRQQEIRDREARLEAILNHAGEGIVTLDETGAILSFNLAAERIFGYKAAEMIGQGVTSLLPVLPGQLKSTDADANQGVDLSGYLGVGRRRRALRKDGESIPVTLTTSKVRQGEDVSFIAIIHDLSEEDRKDAELKQLSRAVEQSPVSIVITNTDGNIEYVNPSFCRMTGYAEREVVGQNPRFLRSGRTSSEEYRNMWDTISGGGTWRGVFQNRTKSGNLFWLSSIVCPVHDQLGAITHYISISEDITDARKKESMLTQAMKLEAIGRMTDGIAHDFNNLLTIIGGNLKFLDEDYDSDNEEHKELIEDAISATRDGADLINRLLTVSRRQELDVQLININNSLLAMERLLHRTVPEISIELELDDDIGYTLVDGNRFESAVLNMVTNARDAMPDGGTIKISTSVKTIEVESQTGSTPVGSYVVLTVRDNGIGMDEETRTRAVEPFFTTKPIGAGTGLGLTMINDFVQQCGGAIEIDSTPGVGTAIELLLPSSREVGDDETAMQIEQDLPRGTETILVVEDRPGVLRFACRTLRRLGYRVFGAEDAAAALSALRQRGGIDLLFSDIVMPGEENGRELAQQVVKEFSDIRVLLTTGMEPNAMERLDYGDSFSLLRKPYSALELARTVRVVLDDIESPQ